MISQKCKYALRAVLFLSANSDSRDQLIGGKTISEELEIPLAFTSKILQELARENIISSVKGPGGGFYLSKKNLKTALIQIVEIIDGTVYFNSCALGLAECSKDHPCPLHETFKASTEKLLHLLKTTTVGSLSNDIKTGLSFVINA